MTLPHEDPLIAPCLVGLQEISPAELFGYDDTRKHPEATETEKRVLKFGNLFLVSNRLGDVFPAGARDLGAYFDDTRMLSTWHLRLAGEPVICLSSHRSREGRSQIDLTVTSRRFGGVFGDPVNFLHLRREQVMHEVFVDRLTLTNYLVKPIDYWLELDFSCDFADVFEVRGARRASRGTYYAPVIEPGRVRLSYLGRDGVFYEVQVSFSPQPSRLTGQRARFELSLVPNETAVLEATVAVKLVCPSTAPQGPRARLTWPPPGDFHPGTRGSFPPSALSFAERSHALRSSAEEWSDRCTHFRTNDEYFDDLLDEAVADLWALNVECGGQRVISAGIPWYTAPFGRDAILTAFEALPVTLDLARDALAFLAAQQGQVHDRFREEAPGRILHEVRRGEMARALEVPHSPYYGTADATPLWLMLLSEYFQWTGDEAFVRALLPNADAALEWLVDDGDPDRDGFIEYARLTEHGLLNQGWKDSTDGISFPDGTPCEPPIALVEVQGYAADAERRLAELHRSLGDKSRAAVLAERARARMRRLDQSFWMPAAGTYGLALDGSKRVVPTLASNAGHLLFSRVVPDARARKLAQAMLSPALWSGWGIRTLGTGQRVYNPLSYHNGTIWPHDNALIAHGLALYGYSDAACRVLSGLVDAAHHFDGRLPELYCGFERHPATFPVQYPVACLPQAWSSAAVFGALRAVLGIFPDAQHRRLEIIDPALPPWLDEIELRGLRVGRTRLDLRFERRGVGVFTSVLRQEGEPLTLRVTIA